MSNVKIVSTGPIGKTAIDILEKFGPVVFCPDFKESTLIDLLDNTIGLVLRGGGAATKKVIESAQHLKVIGRSGVGYDNVDVVAATARQIPVVFTPGAGARAVAEAAMTFMLALCKDLIHWDLQLKAGNWTSRFEKQSGDLDGATLGIIGFGRIGQLLAELAAPFNMTIVAYDPLVGSDKATQLGVRLVELDELIAGADFICIHAALTDKSRGLINRERLQHVKRGAYLVNVARGGLVESLDVLHEALKDGRLAGVGLDVFDPEPPDSSHPIFREPACMTSPHSLAATRGAMEKIYKSMADDMAAILSGRRPRFVVNPEVLAPH